MDQFRTPIWRWFDEDADTSVVGADRIRYGKIKYTWDPGYQAAKKKTKKDRAVTAVSRTEFSTPSTSTSTRKRQPKHNHTTTTFTELPDVENEEKLVLDINQALKNADHNTTDQASRYDLMNENVPMLEYELDHKDLYVHEYEMHPVESYGCHVVPGPKPLLSAVIAVCFVGTCSAGELVAYDQCDAEMAVENSGYPAMKYLLILLSVYSAILAIPFVFHAWQLLSTTRGPKTAAENGSREK